MTVVSNTLTISDATPSAKGFGTVLLAGDHTHFPGIRKYTADNDGLLGMIADGFTVDDQLYLMAQKFCSQAPHGNAFEIGAVPAVAETFSLTVDEASEGAVYAVILQVGSDPAVTVSYTALVTDTTPTLVAAGLEALIDDVSGVTSTPTTDTIAISSTSQSKRVKVRGYTRNMSLTVGGSATGYSAAFTALDAAVQASDTLDFYAFCIQDNSDAKLAAALSYAESSGHIFVGLSADADVFATGTADVCSVGHASNLHRSAIVCTRDQGGRADVSLLARQIAYTPPAISSFHGKKLSGPIVDVLTPTEASNVQSKFGISYYKELGIAMTHDGWALSGRFLDLTILADWVVARINEALVALVASRETIPFDSTGEALVQAAISGVLAQAEKAHVIAPQGDPLGGWVVTVPRSADVPVLTRAARRYPGSKYSFRALGSMHYLDVTGSMGI